MTAVEWLVDRLDVNKMISNPYPGEYWNLLKRHALEMEKEQIKDACNEWFTEGCRYATGFEQTVWEDEEQYYNKTFKSE